MRSTLNNLFGSASNRNRGQLPDDGDPARDRRGRINPLKFQAKFYMPPPDQMELKQTPYPH